ncbi:hypothetical protein DPMN_100716 [Dreissena polymorpha]|uniref:Uncharacterized protein n=1 Tax=Dreissena polymorpha TaxID=45954 RepID=A0A9D4LG93_DREPO|nr:hypothetical protein DPMN_100716 [Dreissena polymorpha]
MKPKVERDSYDCEETFVVVILVKMNAEFTHIMFYVRRIPLYVVAKQQGPEGGGGRKTGTATAIVKTAALYISQLQNSKPFT